MSNTILTPTMITREGLRILHSKLNFLANCNTQYDERFAFSGGKIGNTLVVGRYPPPRPVLRLPVIVERCDTEQVFAAAFVSKQVTLEVEEHVAG